MADGSLPSRQRVYATLTADLGVGRRAEDQDARNVIDLDGLLHVDDVDRFIDALRAWQRDVRRHQVRGATLREVRAAIAGGAR